jgi:hypothetical protein
MKKKIVAVLVTTLLLPVATFAASLSYTYVQALDTFLNKLETYQNNSNYINILDSFSEQIKNLKSRYDSSGNVPLMIDYLVAGVADLKARKLATNTNDEFFTNLENVVSGLGSSSSSTSSTSSSG